MIPLSDPDLLELMPRVSGPIIHPEAMVEGVRIGPGTRIDAFAQVHSGAVLGCDCHVYGQTVIEGGAQLADRVVIQPGVFVPEGTFVESDVVIGANATICTAPAKGAKSTRTEVSNVIVRQGARIGGGAILCAGVEIGEGAVVHPGAVVERSVPPYTNVAGNPAATVPTSAKTRVAA